MNPVTAHPDRPSAADVAVAQERIREHFDEFAPDYHRAAFSGAGMAHLSDLDLAAVRAAAGYVDARDGALQACDVGVGTGRISGELLRLGFELVGVDQSPGMLVRAAEALPDARLLRGSLAGRLPVDTDHADLVTCLRVVKYLPDWRAAIAELSRVARPGGVVCFDLANAHSPARLGYPTGMVWPVTFADALTAIAAAGLDLIDVRAGVHVPDPLWRRARTSGANSAVRAIETSVSAVFGRHGARSWTFVCRKRSERRPA